MGRLRMKSSGSENSKMKSPRFLSAIAPILLLGCQNADQSIPKGQKQKEVSFCLEALPAPIKLDGGTVFIGSNNAYPEERPERTVKLESFQIDAVEITNKQFSDFIEETGYITDAEKRQPGFDVPGGAVFSLTTAKWKFAEGANWRHPDGSGSTIVGRAMDPVVQVTLNDARAYANWAGRRLPSESEWEFAAKAGENSFYTWGDERAPGGKEKANTWQGAFPIQNTSADGFDLRAPIGCFEPNAFGLYDMIGNVWEWTDTPWGSRQSHVIKGGSFLCAENFCRRYRASAKQPQEANFSTNHIGFRTVAD